MTIILTVQKSNMPATESESKKSKAVNVENQHHGRSEVEAATKIQAAFRGMKARNEVIEIKEQRAEDLTISELW